MLRSEDLLSRVPGVFRCVSSPSHRVRQPPWSAAVRLVCTVRCPSVLSVCRTLRAPRPASTGDDAKLLLKHERRTPRARPFSRAAGAGITVYFK